MQFMKGGKFRQAVVKDSTNRGKMDPRQVDLLLGFIKDWCLRDEVRVTHGLGANALDVNVSSVDDIPALDKTPRALSPIVRDSFPSSPPEPPPSSLPPSRIEVRLIQIIDRFHAEFDFATA